MVNITFRNACAQGKSLDGRDLICYKQTACPGTSRAPLQRGVASAAHRCRDAVVNTGFRPGRVGIAHSIASETFASSAKVLLGQAAFANEVKAAVHLAWRCCQFFESNRHAAIEHP